MDELLLVLGGGAIGFLLGMIAMLLLRPFGSVERAPEAGARGMSLEELGRTERQRPKEETHDAHERAPGEPDRGPGRTGSLTLTTRISAPVAILTAQGGRLGNRSWLLRYAASTTVGRFDDCDIAIDDHGVSRLHAQITHRTDAATSHEFAIFDYSSTNGTLVNDQPINAVASLQDGDMIRIGNTEFLFRRVRRT